MEDIELTELPKSKEFMKHAKIADGLTKETGLEYGFIFCKPKDKIIVDKMCVGNECSIKVSALLCDRLDNRFHTHVKTKKEKSKFSVGDIHNSAYSSYVLKQPHITCVKSVTDDNVLCYKSEIKNKKTVQLAQIYKNELHKKPTYKRQENSLEILHKLIKPESILFNANTKEISSYRYID